MGLPASGMRPGVSGMGPCASGMGLPASGVGPGVSGMGPRVSGLRPGASGMRPRVSDVGPGASGMRPCVSGVGPGASGLRPGASGVGPRVSGLRPGTSGMGPRASGLGPGASGHGPRVSDMGPGVSGLRPGASGHGPPASGLGPRASGHAPLACGHDFTATTMGYRPSGRPPSRLLPPRVAPNAPRAYRPPMSTIDFIGGEKGGVGKSVVARLVVQYAIDRGIPFAAVDADASHGTLRRHHGEQTRAVDLSRFESADEIMALAIEPDRRVVVDLPAQSERLLLRWILETGVLALAREQGVDLDVWHVIDDGKDSVITLDRMLGHLGSAVRWHIVKNHGRGQDFSLFEGSSTRAAAVALGALVIDVPALHPGTMAKIDRCDAGFWAAVNDPAVGADTFTPMDRQRIKVWLQAAHAAFAPAFAFRGPRAGRR